MPIVYHQLHPLNAAQPGYAVAKELARQATAFYNSVAGIGVGIGGGSCRSAVAVVPNANFHAVGAIINVNPPPNLDSLAMPAHALAALPYAIALGNSRLAANGLVPDIVGGHAERAALTGAVGTALYSIGAAGAAATNAVLYVELTPCPACQAWLNGGGGGVANPFNGRINAVPPAPGAPAPNNTTLHVWWRWDYPPPPAPPPAAGMGRVANLGSVAEMNLWHTVQWSLSGQLTDIGSNRW